MIVSEYGEGMTVGELRAALKDVPSDVPVMGYWETIYVPLQGTDIVNGFFVLDVDQ